MTKLLPSVILFIFLFCYYPLCAQLYNIDEGQLTDFLYDGYIESSLIFSTPFLRKSVDARSGGLGDVGIASSPDANAIYFNASKLAFSDSNFGVAVNLAPMFLQLGLDDRVLTSIGTFLKFGERNVLGLEFKHFSSGMLSSDLPLMGFFSGKKTATESLFSFAYARKWTNNFASALTLKYIYSNIGYTSEIQEGIDVYPGQAIAADLSFTYTKPLDIGNNLSNLILGLAITNLGSQITYTNDGTQEYLPANIGLGLGWLIKYNKVSSISFLVDVNKLLVPTPNACQGLICSPDIKNSSVKAAWRSFYDADGGLSEELLEVYYSAGLEYKYKEKLFLRTGYLYEHPTKGNRQKLTFGIGYGFQKIVTDFSMQIPFIKKETIDNRFRFSISYTWEKSKDSKT